MTPTRTAPRLLAAVPVGLACAAGFVPTPQRDTAVLPRPVVGLSGAVAASPPVPGGRQVFAPFEVVNTGPVPVTVAAVTPDCGCLAPHLGPLDSPGDRRPFDPDRPPVIPPGGRLGLLVRADTAREPVGPAEHTIELTCRAGSDGDAAETRHAVRVRYAVGPHEVRVSPPAVMVFQGEADRTTRTVTVTDRRTDPLRVAAVRSPSGRVHVEALPPVPRADGGVDLPIELTAVGCEPGGREYVVAVEVADPAGRYTVLKLPVTVYPLAGPPAGKSAGDTAGDKVAGDAGA